MAGNELAMSDQAQEKRKAQWRQEAQLWSLASRGGLGTVSGDVVADGDSENSGEKWKNRVRVDRGRQRLCRPLPVAQRV